MGLGFRVQGLVRWLSVASRVDFFVVLLYK